jgi:tetratricopeptide (TPR) repeat protein
VGVTLWAGGLVLSCALVLGAVLGVPLPGTPPWLAPISRAAPAAMLIVGVGASIVLAARSGIASTTMAVGAVAVAAWTAWLFSYLFADRATNYGMSGLGLTYIAAGLGALSLPLVVRGGGSVFRLSLVATFTYLSFQAIRNINLFGVVAGSVLAWNIGEWFGKLAAGRPHRPTARVAPALVAGLVAIGAFAVVTDRYYMITGDNTHFGLREKPLTFGHDAARFAGRAGLPQRALVFDLGQTGVYVYHNGPDRKVFMDARLELPSLSTFQTYVRIEEWLNHSDPRWDAAIARLGDPLVLISHDGWAEAEAALLTHRRWRCIYFDAIASVFVTREGPSSAPTVPDYDFMAARFDTGSGASLSVDVRTAAAEATALYRLGRAVRKRGGDPWRIRIPILTRASNLTRVFLARETVNLAPGWRLLGLIQWEMAPDLTRPPPGPSDPWDLATGLSWARASYCFRRALETKPDDAPTLRSLADCLGIRGMSDARREVELVLTGKSQAVRPGAREAERPTGSAALPWSAADRLAVNYLHLGEPESARRAWSEATAPASPALRLTRLAEADLAALDARSASARCHQALELDSKLGEAWLVLTIAALDSGQAESALASCREGLKRELTDPQSQTLAGIERLLSRNEQSNRKRD